MGVVMMKKGIHPEWYPEAKVRLPSSRTSATAAGGGSGGFGVALPLCAPLRESALGCPLRLFIPWPPLFFTFAPLLTAPQLC